MEFNSAFLEEVEEEELEQENFDDESESEEEFAASDIKEEYISISDGFD